MFESEALTVDQVAGILGLSRNTVYKFAKDGTLPSYRIGRKLRFSETEIRAAMISGGLPSQTSQASTKDRTKAASVGETVQNYAPADAHGHTLSTLTDSTLVSGKTAPGSPLTKSMTNSTEPAINHLIASADSQLVLAGSDQIASVLAHHFNAVGHTTCALPMNSYAALVNLYLGNTDMALVHLYDFRTNSYNLPYIQRLCPGTPVVVLRILRRKQGFFVLSGNPRKIKTWGGLLREEVRLAPREKGSGARILLDQKLLSMEADLSEAEQRSMSAAASAVCIARVAEGAADVAIGYKEEAALAAGISFIPLQTECLDLVIRKTRSTKRTIRTLRELTASHRFQDVLAQTIECDASVCGSIVYEC